MVGAGWPGGWLDVCFRGEGGMQGAAEGSSLSVKWFIESPTLWYRIDVMELKEGYFLDSYFLFKSHCERGSLARDM
jgi:hypothetical protein